MKKIVFDFKRDFIVSAAISVALGIVFIIWPDASARIVCYIFGAISAILALLEILAYARAGANRPMYAMKLTLGIISALLAVFAFASPAKMISVLPLIMGIAVLVDSLIKLKNSVQLFTLHSRGGMIQVLLAVLGAILGIAMIWHPFGTAKVIFIFVGVALLINGVSDFISLAFVGKKDKTPEAPGVIVEDAESVSFDDDNGNAPDNGAPQDRGADADNGSAGQSPSDENK